jgi:hypothetical protein
VARHITQERRAGLALPPRARAGPALARATAAWVSFLSLPGMVGYGATVWKPDVFSIVII